MACIPRRVPRSCNMPIGVPSPRSRLPAPTAASEGRERPRPRGRPVPSPSFLTGALPVREIQGEWVAIEEELNGKRAPKADVKATNRRVTIRGHSLTMSRVVSGRLGAYTGKFEIDAASGSFDFVGKNPGGNYVEFRGI